MKEREKDPFKSSQPPYSLIYTAQSHNKQKKKKGPLKTQSFNELTNRKSLKTNIAIQLIKPIK